MVLSFKYGEGARLSDGRLFVDHTAATLCAALSDLPVDVVDVWTTHDVRPGRADDRWTNLIAVRH